MLLIQTLFHALAIVSISLLLFPLVLKCVVWFFIVASWLLIIVKQNRSAQSIYFDQVGCGLLFFKNGMLQLPLSSKIIVSRYLLVLKFKGNKKQAIILLPDQLTRKIWHRLMGYLKIVE